MVHLTCCLLATVTMLTSQSWVGDETAPLTSGASEAGLTVIWAQVPAAKPKPFGVVLVEPADGIAAKGRVNHPGRRQEVFSYRRDRGLARYYLDVRKQRCEAGQCQDYHPISSLCTRKVNVEPEEAVTATVRLRSPRDCVIRLSR